MYLAVSSNACGSIYSFSQKMLLYSSFGRPWGEHSAGVNRVKGHLLEEEDGEQNVEMKVQDKNSAHLAGEVGIDGSGEDKQLVLRQLLFHLRRLFL